MQRGMIQTSVTVGSMLHHRRVGSFGYGVFDDSDKWGPHHMCSAVAHLKAISKPRFDHRNQKIRADCPATAQGAAESEGAGALVLV